MVKNIFKDLGKVISKGAKGVAKVVDKINDTAKGVHKDIKKGAKKSAGFVKDTVNKGVDGVKEVGERLEDTHNKVMDKLKDKSKDLPYLLEEAPDKIDVEIYQGPKVGWDASATQEEQEKIERKRKQYEQAEEILGVVFSLVRDGSFAFQSNKAIAGTWAGVDVFQMLVHKMFSSVKPEEPEAPDPFLLLFENLTSYYKNCIESKQIKDDLALVASVYDTISTYSKSCQGKDKRNLLNELEREGGILFQLVHLRSNPTGGLKVLLNRLLADESLGFSDEMQGYTSKNDYEIACQKLALFANAIGAYLISFKTYIMLDDLRQTLKQEPAFSGDLIDLKRETEAWSQRLKEKVDCLKKRRLASVVDTHGRTTHEYVNSPFEPSKEFSRQEFDKYLDINQPDNRQVRDHMGHYGITWRELFEEGSQHFSTKKLVEFVIDNRTRRHIGKNYISKNKDNQPQGLFSHSPSWAYDGFKDQGADHDDSVFRFMQDCVRKARPFKTDDTTWHSRKRTSDLYKAAYKKGLEEYLDKKLANYSTLVSSWENAVLEYKYQIVPPMNPPHPVKIQEWLSTASKNLPWSQDDLSVRYGIRYGNKVGESAEIVWAEWNPILKRQQPKLVDIPSKIKDFAELSVTNIKIYRQFLKKEDANPTSEELIANLIRDDLNNEFPSEYIDAT
ncbi:MAG: hypothetical protein ACSNEK_09165 [Parachlamydiaceae bacterium]